MSVRPLAANATMTTDGSATDGSATDGSAVRETFDRDAVRSASKVVIAAGALVFLLYLFTLLPGVDRLVPLTPVTFAAVVSAVVTVAIAGLLAYAAPKFAALTRMTLQGTDAAEHAEPVVENVAALVYWLVVLAAVIVAHGGLAGAIVPLLGDLAWVYDAAFLLVALSPVVFITARLTVTIDPLSELVADRVAGPDVDDSGENPVTVEEASKGRDGRDGAGGADRAGDASRDEDAKN